MGAGEMSSTDSQPLNQAYGSFSLACAGPVRSEALVRRKDFSHTL
jgi:hypothetical protein